MSLFLWPRAILYKNSTSSSFSFSIFCNSINRYEHSWMIRMEISCKSVFRNAQTFPYALYLLLPPSDHNNYTWSFLFFFSFFA